MPVREGNIIVEQFLMNIGQVSLTTALVILPLLGLRRVLRKRYPARVLCLVWAVLVVRLLIPVQFSLPEAPVQVEPRMTHVRYENGSMEHYAYTEGFAESEGVRTWISAAEVPETENVSSATYFGAILFLIWLGVGGKQFIGQMGCYFAFLRRVKRTAVPVDSPELLAAYRAEAERLGVSREIPLLLTTGADGPMLVGILRPMLLLPARGVPAADAPMIFRHELTHYKRHDLLLKLAATAARCMHWFNPAVHWLVRSLYEDIELACDSRVVEGMDTAARKRYGEAILNCAASQCAARQPLTTCFTSDKESLKTRLSELFVTGVKKRGVALLVVCAMTVGIAGGSVAIGQTAGAVNDRIDQATAAALANSWAEARMHGERPPLELRTEKFSSEVSIPDGKQIDAYTILPDLENNAANVVYNWYQNGRVDTRSCEYLRFAQENGVWKLAAMQETSAANAPEIDSAEEFVLLYGNDLGLPDFMKPVDEAIEPRSCADPVQMVQEYFYLEGGTGAITGEAAVRTTHVLGDIVTYTFADGTSIDFTVSDYFVLDWSIGGENTRTMVDLASQWARGTMYKDTHVMFPLLTENATGELIKIQQNYSGTTGDEWYWKHGKYGSSPTADEFGVFCDVGEDAVRIVYAEASSGDPYTRTSEILRFKQTDEGLKIDSVRDLTTDEWWLDHSGGMRNYELIDRNEMEWFTMLFLEEPVAGNLSRLPDYGRMSPERDKSDPVEMAGALLQISEDGNYAAFQGDLALLSRSADAATVRIDFSDGSGHVFAELHRTAENAWELTAVSKGELSSSVQTAEQFAETYGGGFDLPVLQFLQGEISIIDPVKAAEQYLALEGGKAKTGDDVMVDGKRLGVTVSYTFADGSQVDLTMSDPYGAGYIPVDWTIDGGNNRNIHDLAVQWAAGTLAKDTHVMFPLLTERATGDLLEVQKDYSGEDWVWKHGKYGSSPTADGFELSQIGENEVKIVYNEWGGGYFNHHSGEILSFAKVNGAWKIDGWTEIERTTQSDYQWYQTMYEENFTCFNKTLTGWYKPGDAAKLLAGVDNGDGLDVYLMETSEVILADLTDVPGWQVKMDFTDGSGHLMVNLYEKEIDGETVWTLESVLASERE